MGKHAPPPQPSRPLQKPHLRFSPEWGSGKLPQAQPRPRGPGLQSLLPTRVKALRAAWVGPELREPTLLRAHLALPQESSRSHTHLHPADGSVPLKAQSATEQPPAQSAGACTHSTHTPQYTLTDHTRTSHRLTHTPHGTHTRTSHRLTHTPQYTHRSHIDQPQTHTHTPRYTHRPAQTHTPTAHTQCCSPHIFTLLCLFASTSRWRRPLECPL